MGLLTWVAIGAIALVIIGLGWGVFFSGLFRGAQVISQNPVVQNATKESIEAANKQTTITSDNTVVVVHTEKTVYKVTDPVVIVLKNQGNDKVKLGDSSPNVEIRNEDTGKTYSVTATEVKTELEPGDTITIVWDKTRDIDSGTYIAVVKANDGTTIGETTFTVET